LAARIASENALCGVTCLPGFDYDDNETTFKEHGYSFEEMGSSLREATKTLLGQSKNPNAQLTGVFHDWGCGIGTMVVHRMNQDKEGTFSKVVLFDVLMPVHPSQEVKLEDNPKKALSALAYRVVLAICFLLKRYISFYVAAPFFTVCFALLNIMGLNPMGKLDKETYSARASKPSMQKLLYMTYPYWNLICTIANTIRYGTTHDGLDIYMPSDLVKTPLLYMYGTEKPVSFHDDNELAWLIKQHEKSPTTKVIAVENAGHWLFIQQQDTCFNAMKEFLFGK
jgi:pimeloyl-ACP methyl ester carboxylesterase